MKTANLVMALLVTLGLSFSGITIDTSFAKSSTKEEKKTESKKKESKKKKSKTADTKKSKKSTKELPAPKSISINKASKDELMTVPGIGPKTADAIISYRKGKKFSSIEDLTKVKGIGEKTFIKMKKYLKK